MKLSEIYKALTAGATALAGMEGVAAMIDGAATQPIVHAAAVAFSAVVTAATWFVRNRATFDQIAHAIDEDLTVAEKVGDKVATDPVIIEKVVIKNTDLVGELINQYRSKNH